MKIITVLSDLETSARDAARLADETRIQQALTGTPAKYLPPSGAKYRVQADNLRSTREALSVLWRDAHQSTAAAAALVATLQQLKLPSEEAQSLLVQPRPHQRPQRAPSAPAGASPAILPPPPPPPTLGSLFSSLFQAKPKVVRLAPGPMPTDQMVHVTPRRLPSWMHWVH